LTCCLDSNYVLLNAELNPSAPPDSEHRPFPRRLSPNMIASPAGLLGSRSPVASEQLSRVGDWSFRPRPPIPLKRSLRVIRRRRAERFEPQETPADRSGTLPDQHTTGTMPTGADATWTRRRIVMEL
jgi:hypothetical protein